jgi:hypothetical protein
MTSIPAIRDGLADRLRTIQGLRVYDTYSPSINPPAAVVVPAPGDFLEYDQAMGGVDTVNLVIGLFVSKAIDRVAQEKLDAYLANTGPLSIKAAVDGDVDLGGIVHFAVVTSARNYGIKIFGEGEAATPYLGCEFTVTVGAM